MLQRVLFNPPGLDKPKPHSRATSMAQTTVRGHSSIDCAVSTEGHSEGRTRGFWDTRFSVLCQRKNIQTCRRMCKSLLEFT